MENSSAILKNCGFDLKQKTVSEYYRFYKEKEKEKENDNGNAT